MLLGNKVHLRFNMPPSMAELELVGMALGVKHHAGVQDQVEQFSVHIKFDQSLNEKDISETERYLKLTGMASRK
jgi:hypothetical protein